MGVIRIASFDRSNLKSLKFSFNYDVVELHELEMKIQTHMVLHARLRFVNIPALRSGPTKLRAGL